MTRVLAFVRREPVRAVLTPLVVALVGYLVVRGVLTAATAPLVLALVAAVLGVPATELIRSQVTPTVKIPDVVKSAAGAVIPGAPAEVVQAVGQVADEVANRIGRHRR